MARFQYQTREWIVGRIKYLENQLTLGAKWIATADGSTTLVSASEANDIIADLQAALDERDAIPLAPPKQAVFKIWTVRPRYD